jgi:hypothetical protein
MGYIFLSAFGGVVAGFAIAYSYQGYRQAEAARRLALIEKMHCRLCGQPKSINPNGRIIYVERPDWRLDRVIREYEATRDHNPTESKYYGPALWHKPNAKQR